MPASVLNSVPAGPMGSGEGSFALAEILGRGYGLQQQQDEGSPHRTKTLEDLERSLAATRTDEMPLEELLALYGYEVSDRISGDGSEPTDLPAHLPDMTLDKDQIAKDLLSGEEDEETPSPPDDLTPSVTSHASDLFRLHLRAHVQVGEGRDISSSSADEDSEGSSAPSSEGRKDIMVGPQYQAAIPPLSPSSCQDRAYENEDQLLWSPGVLPGEAVEDFLLRAQGWGGEEGATETPTAGDIIRDSEQALYELVKCSFNMEEALRRLSFNVKVFREELCAWSEEECRNFEHGYRVYGKNFHLIQANKVRTRSVGECVEYYYSWKRSDRHDCFTLQTSRLGRSKKYSLQPGNMEDGEQDGEGRGSRSHSPPQGPGTTPQLHPPLPS
ncbi:mesoderm induction early response protein 2-like isoform X1 [Conger conger]|uniref:mesoderm induction early response protein 2-like isoform X1 n=2 Tax=Conger conger TaxID=82655 RepID=UPI002A5B0987|nr:mesoderm induction early response protein 2-like isoform X1 [Conger conger]